jgi:hypothetical protein
MELITILNRCRLSDVLSTRTPTSVSTRTSKWRPTAQWFGRSLLALPFAVPGYDQFAPQRFEFYHSLGKLSEPDLIHDCPRYGG